LFSRLYQIETLRLLKLYFNLFFHLAFEFILSVGSSHHIGLYDLLNSSYNLLNKNDFFIVSDEFIAPFITKYQREKNLILHHTYVGKDPLALIFLFIVAFKDSIGFVV
jgi:hypothetical protein